MDDLMNLDLYELIGAVQTATVKDIKKAYRKKALSCHPDKNPDNPKAAELFHQLSRALEVLTDVSARDAYDRVLNAKLQAKLRTRELDSRRKKLKEDLEAREEAHRKSQRSGGDTRTDEQKLQAEIERLRKEGSKQVEEEVAFVRQQIIEDLRKMNMAGTGHNNGNEYRIKIRWKAAKDDPDNGGYDYEILHRILSKYGDVTVLVMSPNKKGRALVEYTTKDAAEMAVQIEQGLSNNPINLDWLSKPEKSSKNNVHNTTLKMPQSKTSLFPSTESSNDTTGCNFPSFSSAPDIFTLPSKMSDAEFESSVLSNLRRAQERKRLIEELTAEEDT